MTSAIDLGDATAPEFQFYDSSGYNESYTNTAYDGQFFIFFHFYILCFTAKIRKWIKKIARFMLQSCEI